MKFFKLAVVCSAQRIFEDVYNDENVANKVFANVEVSPLVMGAKLYRCEFENGRLVNKECIKSFDHTTKK